MIEPSEVSILVPAFNEEETIQELIRRIRIVSDQFEIVVCSDGSTDNTVPLAREAGVVVVDQPFNQGNGATVKAAARAASRSYLVMIDADLQHPPEEIPKLLEKFPEYDLVVGSRTNESKTSLVRNVGNFVLKKLAGVLTGQKIHDLTSGFRAVKREVFFEFYHLYPQKYSYPTTLTIASLQAGHKVDFLPLPSISRRSKGSSGIRPIQDGIRFTNIILRMTMLFGPIRIFMPFAAALFVLGV